MRSREGERAKSMNQWAGRLASGFCFAAYRCVPVGKSLALSEPLHLSEEVALVDFMAMPALKDCKKPVLTKPTTGTHKGWVGRPAPRQLPG